MRVLIFSAKTGGGHMRTSQAIQKIIMERDPESTVEIVDALKYISPVFDKAITEGYFQMATKTPAVFGAFYRVSDRENTFSSLFSKMNAQFGKRLIPKIKKYNPDIIIAAHPFVAMMLSNLKEKYTFPSPVICLLTDFAPHRTYINEKIDAYVVATEEMVSQITQEYHTDKTIIYPLGIQVDPKFYSLQKMYNKLDLKKEMKLNPDLPVILVMAGSFGVTDVLKIYQSIVEIDTEFQIIVVTGRNKRLYSAFKKLLSKTEDSEIVIEVEPEEDPFESIEIPNFSKNAVIENVHKTASKTVQKLKFRKNVIQAKPTKLLYFVNDIERYMYISDLIVTKPGGLTVSESLITGLPLAVFKAIPGQEDENAKYLFEHNMAIILDKHGNAGNQIKELLENPEKLSSMKHSCQDFAKNKSPDQFYNLLVSFSEKKAKNI
ncbi:MAG: glycosyltransferase [Bacillota bacterium]|nr:glycosyltransferase [Bacillota bacterium]